MAEWMTMSAPYWIARWLMGVAKVESMQTSAPRAWHNAAMRRTSTQRKYGLVGDSEKKSETCCSSSTRSREAMSAGSITEAVMPILGNTYHRHTPFSPHCLVAESQPIDNHTKI